jgi:putative salt-induced outer membrane protein YdiY
MIRFGVLMVLLALPVLAEDEVKLKNGDRVSGKVLSLNGGKLEIETPAMGKVQVDWAQVESVKTEDKIKVRVATGEEFEGKLASGAEKRLKIQSEGAAAPIEVDPASVTHFNKPPTAWHGNINVALRATDGNTHTKSGLATAQLNRTSEVDEFIVRAIWRYGQDSGELTERNTYGLGKYSHNLAGDLYGFGSAELLSDTFKDIKLRTILAAGLGYKLVKESWMDFSLEAGLAYVNNNYDELQLDEDHLGARASANLRLDLFWGFQFRDLFTIYPNLDESQDFQIRNEATLTNNLGQGWSLIGGVITEYDRTPAPDTRRHDNTYFVGLGYSF